MADQDARPLSDEERAELEALRAEKARRERAELEALRAEQFKADAASAPSVSAAPVDAAKVRASHSTLASAAPQPVAAPTKNQPVAPTRQAVPATGSKDPAERTFGERMVLSEGEDDDGIPTMPPAQKITIAVCLVIALALIAYFVLGNLGIL